jgi:hypothetical protein
MVDWMDIADAQAGLQTRAWLYGRSAGMIAHHLANIAARWGSRLVEPTFVARFWLESVFGHARMSTSIDTTPDWSRRHAKIFESLFERVD